MAEYMLLIYDDESALAAASEGDWEQLLAAHRAFGAEHASALRGGSALQPAATATSLRPGESGEFTVTDAPFAETKEALGGYYLIEAADLDEALAIAKRVPVFAGGVEVRPVRSID